MLESEFFPRLPTCFPHILTGILRYLPGASLASFRLVCRAFRVEIDRRLQRHLTVAWNGSSSALCPIWSAEWDMRRVETIDMQGLHPCLDPDSQRDDGCYAKEVFNDCELLLQFFPRLRHFRVIDHYSRALVNAIREQSFEEMPWPRNNLLMGGLDSPKSLSLVVPHTHYPNSGDIIWLEIRSATSNDAAYVLLDVRVPVNRLVDLHFKKRDLYLQMRDMGLLLPMHSGLIILVGLEAWGCFLSNTIPSYTPGHWGHKVLSKVRTEVRDASEVMRADGVTSIPEAELERLCLVNMEQFSEMVSGETLELAADLYHNERRPPGYDSLREGRCVFGCERENGRCLREPVQEDASAEQALYAKM